MTPNHEIPFTEARPTEAGAYWFKEKLEDKYPSLLEATLLDGSDEQLIYLHDGLTKPNPPKGFYSCKLIPSTALDEAKRRVHELEEQNRKLEQHILSLQMEARIRTNQV